MLIVALHSHNSLVAVAMRKSIPAGIGHKTLDNPNIVHGPNAQEIEHALPEQSEAWLIATNAGRWCGLFGTAYLGMSSKRLQAKSFEIQ